MSQVSQGGYRTLSAFFDSKHEAERAVDRLIDAGVPRSDVRLVPGYENDTPTTDRTEQRTSIFGALADFFFPEEDRHTYAEGLSRGGYLVVVDNLSNTLHDTAVDILDDEGSIDLDEREETWRMEGWTGYSAGAGGEAPSGTAMRDRSLGRNRVRSYSRGEGFGGDRNAVEVEDQRMSDAERLKRF